MQAGYRGTFVISWAQTEIDGAVAAPTEALCVGAIWRWTGRSVRVDGPAELLLLCDSEGEAERRRRAARIVRRLMGAAVAGRNPAALREDEVAPQHGFVVTDGRRSFAVSLIEVPASRARLLMFSGAEPPRDTDLWVVGRTVETPARSAASGGVICFTPGTAISTPSGDRPIDTLRPGDLLATRDDGPQEILWTGRRRLTGARLFAMPELRPVRIRAGSIGAGCPRSDLVVSPDHRMLVRGSAARALFNADEVLVAARDLVDGAAVKFETRLTEVTYIHLLTERHEVIRANGAETETFHPAASRLDQVEPGQRAALFALMPDLERDPFAYGAFARRNLTAPEAAILRHRAA